MNAFFVKGNLKKKLKGEDSHGQQHHSKPGYLFSFKL